MTRTAHDHFAKQFVEDLLSPIGQVELDRRISGEARQTDVWFAPHPDSEVDRQGLGMLGQMVAAPCLLEPFRNPVQPTDVRNCMSKLYDLQAELRRKAKRKQARSSNPLPRLWILTPSASGRVLTGFAATVRGGWTDGVYFLPEQCLTAVVAINALPTTTATLWLRLMGRGTVQEQAIAELLTLPTNYPFKRQTLEHLAVLRVNLEARQNLNRDERDLAMKLTPAYEQWYAETIQKGQQAEARRRVESLLRLKFGTPSAELSTLDPELFSIVEPLTRLSIDACNRLILQLSREEMIAHFQQQADN